MTRCSTIQQNVCSDSLPPILLPPEYNYIGAFLTLECNLCCSYCINRFGILSTGGRMLSGEEWLRGLNRIVPRPDLPVTLQGGEPTLHPDFFPIVNGIRPDLLIDLLTNLEVDPDNFLKGVPPERIKREAPYSSIRVSYHPEGGTIEELAAKVLTLQRAGYSIGIWGVLHPRWEMEINRALDYCTVLGIDFRTKDFLGEHEGDIYGALSYHDACDRSLHTDVLCRTTELIIGPGGDVFRCHGDLYEGREAIGHILDPEFTIDHEFSHCSNYGYCNPCDVKLKTDRFQQFGHTSVEIMSAPLQDLLRSDISPRLRK